MLGYMKTATRFARVLGERRRLREVSGSDVAAFVRRAGVGHKPKTVNNIVIGLRSFLRFLYADGLIEARCGRRRWAWPVGGAALCLAGPGRRGGGDIGRMRPSSLLGARDFAMIMLITRLGFEPGEVAALSLDDLDWAAGEVMVHGKGGTAGCLAVPVDVGDALAGYLSLRGPSAVGRQVFLHVKAPRSGVAMTDVRCAVRRACWRAGLADTGTHRFRHSLATEMLARGAPWLRSARSCVTDTWRPPLFTPKWTW